MKKVITIVLLFLFTAGMHAQQGINYKALIKDGGGTLIVNEIIDVRFTIIADTGPTDVYLETHTSATTDANGILILVIGEGTSSDTFTDIAWGNDIHSLKVEIDIEQDGSFLDMGTTQFMTVPYALASGDNYWSKNSNGIYTLGGDVGIGVDDPQAKLDILGGDWNLDAGNPGDLRIGNATNNFRIGIATGGGGAGITRMYTNSNALFLGTNDTPALILEGNGTLKAPALTNTLINDGGDKALITKEYIDTYSKVKTITISAAAFNPSSNSSTFRISNGTKAYCEDSSSFIFAPLTLPAGTVINEITAYTFDSSASNDLEFSVGRAYNLGGQIPSIIFTRSTTGASGLQPLTHPNNFTISDNYQYFIRIRPALGDSWNNSDLSIAQVRVIYTE